MNPLPFDPENPPDSPPPSVVQPLLWRLAVRVYRDHGGDRVDWTRPGACRTCRRPWPCYPRRMAERGLLVACRAPRLGRGATAYLDDLPGLD
ncbi:MAG TPA: hypothetical protein VFM54_11750 [Micromonosporaceae bacterium]|nr:hypothetical protein [Micromonosporaceae bacterium]